MNISSAYLFANNLSNEIVPKSIYYADGEFNTETTPEEFDFISNRFYINCPYRNVSSGSFFPYVYNNYSDYLRSGTTIVLNTDTTDADFVIDEDNFITAGYEKTYERNFIRYGYSLILPVAKAFDFYKYVKVNAKALEYPINAYIRISTYTVYTDAGRTNFTAGGGATFYGDEDWHTIEVETGRDWRTGTDRHDFIALSFIENYFTIEEVLARTKIDIGKIWFA